MSRSYFPDPMAKVIKLLWPLVVVDMFAWGWYVGGALGKAGVAFWFIVLMCSIVYLKKS